MKRKTILTVITFLNLIAFSQNYLAEGNVLLEGEINHSGVSITFERIAPSSLTYNVNTNSLGDFSETIEEGIYNIVYEKNGFTTETQTDISVYDNIQISSLTLLINGLSGNLSGILTTGTYIVGGDIFVGSGEMLTIEAGCILLFRQDVKFTIIGGLIANGTINDSIIFTKNESAGTWGGINLNPMDYTSDISYSRIEHSNDCGISSNMGMINIHHSVIRNNTNNTGLGGGISIDGAGANLYNLSIYNNQAENGGGLYISESSVTLNISNCLIYNNSAIYNGGAIATSCMDDSPPVISNCVINNNSTGNSYSGAIHEYHLSFDYVNNIISNNEGYGIKYSEENSSDSYSYTAYNNVYGNSNGSFDNPPQNVGVIITTNNNDDPSDAFHNIELDPLFLDLSNSDFHLLFGSPCIDVGLNTYAQNNFDFDENIRIWDSNSDGNANIEIGAFEYDSPMYTSIMEISKDVRIYPNPTNGIVNIKTLNIQKVEVVNMTGKVIYSKNEFHNNKTIDFSDFIDGVYIVYIQTKNDTYQTKIVKNSF